MGTVLLIAVIGGGIFIHYYNFYANIIDRRLSGDIFAHPTLVYAASRSVFPGQADTPEDIAAQLQRAGYDDSNSTVGTFVLHGDLLEVRPGPQSFHSPIPAVLRFQKGHILSITSPGSGENLRSYALEPQLLTSLFNQKREKRRLLKYSDLPLPLVQAVLAAEDRDYFHHGAVNYLRVLASAYNDIKTGRKNQGASTITMQVARNFFLSSEKKLSRKVAEVLIAFELEQRLTKPQIFELYANQTDMGHRGSFEIHGFGEAAKTYFNKDVSQLTVAECALLAGIIHAPNLDSPYRHPDYALRRRNQFVLPNMLKAGWITPEEEAAAEAEPLKLAPLNSDASEAPYFVDLLRDRLSEDLPDRDLTTESLHVYTTLDPDLQRAAAQAVQDGMKLVDAQLEQRYAHRHKGKGGAPMAVPHAQAALIVLDPQTGAVKAMVGGRNYGVSQLDHIVRLRPTGSIFKPIVYAAALNLALQGGQPVLTTTSTVLDQPTVFEGGYAPANFENKYFGRVTLRTALAHSLNNATISVAQEIGYGRVADLAHQLGITSVQPTPSEAIGTYSASPLQMAEAYTVFANHGVRVQPQFYYSVQEPGGQVVLQPQPRTVDVLDPRVVYLVTSMLQSVMNNGTAARVRALGFSAPAAGKTGSSHDGWFAGYTSNLLCLVWVGMDDYTNLDIEGSRSALPIWGEFMKTAVSLPSYHNVQEFTPPAGLVAVKVDDQTLQVATPLCPATHTEYYLPGTQPTEMCTLHTMPITPQGLVSKALNLIGIHTGGEAPPPPATVTTGHGTVVPPADGPAADLPAPEKRKKKGFFGRIFGGGKKASPPDTPPPQDQ